MKIIKAKSIDKVYYKVIKTLKKSKKVDNNTKEIENAILVIKKPSLKNISFPYRNISEKYSEAELKWYWSGDNRCSEIGKYGKIWLSLSDDGITNNSAYGYILFEKYGFNQLEQIIELLKNDDSSRRAVLNISDPSINRIKTKDMQCTIAIQFLIRKNKVNMTVYMRSNDVYFGLPYDYIFFETIHQYLVKRLNQNTGLFGVKYEVGKYTHIATSLHMYEKDFGKFINKKQNKVYIYLSDIKKYYKGEKR